MRFYSVAELGVGDGLKKYVDYPRPDVLPARSEDCWTIGQYMDLVLKEVQAETVKRGVRWIEEHKIDGARLSQTQISWLRVGKAPEPPYWPLYQAALKLTESEFYRLVNNARKIRIASKALQTPAESSEPLFAFAEIEGARIVRLKRECESELKLQAAGA